MNQQTFVSFKSKTDKEPSRSQADRDHFSGTQGLDVWEGYFFWVFYWVQTDEAILESFSFKAVR